MSMSRTWQTCRTCHDIIRNPEDGIKLGDRHWMHWSCVTPDFIERKTQEARRLREKAETSTLRNECIAKAERIERLLARIEKGVA